MQPSNLSEKLRTNTVNTSADVKSWGDEGLRPPKKFAWLCPLGNPSQYLTFVLFYVVEIDGNDSFQV